LKKLATKKETFFFLIILSFVISCSGKQNPKYIRSDEEIEWDGYHETELNDQLVAANDGYKSMCHRDNKYVRACFDYARLSYETSPLVEARKITKQTIVEYSNNALTQAAIKRLAFSYVKTEDLANGILDLKKLEKIIKNPPNDTILYEISKLELMAKQFDAEENTLEQFIARYGRWESPLWDVVIWRLINIQNDKKDTQKAIKLILQLLNENKSSWIVGSYTSPLHDDALFLLGEIYLSEKKYNQALQVFLELSKMKTSRMRDDGLLGAARVKIALEKPKSACRLINKIMKIESSNSARQAKKLAKSINCQDF